MERIKKYFSFSIVLFTIIISIGGCSPNQSTNSVPSPNGPDASAPLLQVSVRIENKNGGPQQDPIDITTTDISKNIGSN
jgi:hypothetical protein